MTYDVDVLFGMTCSLPGTAPVVGTALRSHRTGTGGKAMDKVVI